MPEIITTGRVESIISGVAVGEGVSLLAKSNFRIFQADKVKVLPLDSAADDISSPRKTCRYHRDRGYEEFC